MSLRPPQPHGKAGWGAVGRAHGCARRHVPSGLTPSTSPPNWDPRPRLRTAGPVRTVSVGCRPPAALPSQAQELGRPLLSGQLFAAEAESLLPPHGPCVCVEAAPCVRGGSVVMNLVAGQLLPVSGPGAGAALGPRVSGKLDCKVGG